MPNIDEGQVEGRIRGHLTVMFRNVGFLYVLNERRQGCPEKQNVAAVPEAMRLPTREEPVNTRLPRRR